MISVYESGLYYQSSSWTSHSLGFAAGASGVTEYRNYLVFDVPAFGTNVVSAELWIRQPYFTSKDSSELFELHEVTSTIEMLRQYGTTEPDVFNDLADGPLFGSLTLTPSSQYQVLTIPLNTNFLSKLSSSTPTRIILGGSISTLNADETDSEYFSASTQEPNIQLALTLANSPSPLQLLTQPVGAYQLLDGQEWAFTVRACGADPIFYQWQVNGADIPGATNSVLSFNPLLLGDAGEYQVVVSNSQGSVTSSIAPITVDALRTYTGGSFATSEGFDFSISVFTQSARPAFYQWYHNDEPVPGGDKSLLLIPVATTNDAGNYTVIVTNAVGASTNFVSVTVLSNPPLITNVFTNQIVSQGSTIVLAVTSIGGPPPTFYWYFNDVPLNVANGPQLALINVNTNDAGNYSLVASNRLGSVTNRASLSVAPAGPLDRWTLRNPLPQPNDLHAITYGNGVFVALGLNGALVTSTNGQDWTLQQSRTISELRAVAYGNGRFVAVGNQIILTSADGIQWKNIYPGPYDLSGIAYGNGQFVAAIRNGSPSFLVSSNALDWRTIDFGYYASIKSIAYGSNGLFAAAGTGTGLIVFTSTNGFEWITQSLGVQAEPEAVRYAGGRFVLVGTSGTIFTSNDGSQWLKRTSGITTRLVNVDYGNGAYVAVGVRGVILRSTDLLHWSTVNSGTPDRLEGVVFAQNKFVVVGESGTTLDSTSGSTWLKVGGGTHLDLDGMTIADQGLVMTVGKSGTIITTSNGFDFIFQSPPVTNDLHGVAFASWTEGHVPNTTTIKRHVAVGSEGTIITSDNGLDWTRRNSGSTLPLKAATYGSGLFVVVGAGATILTSSNGISWHSEYSPLGLDLNDVAFGNGMFIIAADHNRGLGSLRSINGRDWIVDYDYKGVNIRGAGFYNNTYALVGNDGNAFFSTGGGWTPHGTGLSQDGDNLRSITYGNGIWAIVGNNGIILTSPDTINWTRRFSPVYANLHGVRYLNGRFVAIGDAGVILQSDRFAPSLESPRQATGGLLLTVHPGIGQSLRLQKSSDLINWGNVTTFTNPPNPSTYLDHVTNGPAFYRAVSP
jgi:hypothetical protein